LNKVYLLVGSNLGDRLNNLETAREQIGREIGQIILESSVYETESWGFTGEDFLNQCILAGSDLSQRELMENIQSIENHMGRERLQNEYENRIIDIDILLYNDEIINTPQLIIPHKEIENRRFVLEPLNEIAPQLIHPVNKKQIRDLLKECTDRSKVAKYTSN
jgi:2-amino-4-hydroxy-6-hydroxymethyldihydropteridine diphosphokinase